MTRILSALILLPVVLGTIWFLPPLATLALALIVLVLAYLEYAALVGRLGVQIPKVLAGVGAMAACAAMAWPGPPIVIVLMVTTITLAGLGIAAPRPGPEALHDVAAALFGVLYLALPLGALVAIRTETGPEPVLLLLLVVIVSDTGQYYGGRLFGRRPLAPALSPKKTVEGALSGVVVATIATVAMGSAWLPGIGPERLALLGATLVLLGIAGDLFASLLKRRAGLKDTSRVIPGHGGMLDRIDSLLFAAPVYYGFLALWRG